MEAMDRCRTTPLYPFRIGVSHHTLPFSRVQGFGDLGVQVLVVDADGQRTAYILIDGNNMAEGMREVLLEEVRKVVDHAEVMTTDSHVVNTITGKNPVGMHVGAPEFLPYVMQALHAALDDLAPSEVAGNHRPLRAYRRLWLQPDLPARQHGKRHACLCCPAVTCDAPPGIPVVAGRLYCNYLSYLADTE